MGYLQPTGFNRASCLFILVLLVTTGLFSVRYLRELASKSTATSQVSDLLKRQEQAWNEGDLDGFMAEYWHSDELRFYSGGTVTSGWQATLDRYRKRYQADGKEMGKLTFEDLEVEVLGPDAAMARGRWKLVLSKEKPEGLFTLILKKFPEGWKIVHDHTSAVETKMP